MINMIIGLTGPTGSGKSTVAQILKEMNFVIIDYDKISRDISKKGSPCVLELRREFGEEILGSDGNLQRKVLGKIVFSDAEKLETLNTITHKYILKESDNLISENSGKNIVLDAPLLFEAELDKKCDFVIGVVAPKDVRIERIMKRDSIDKAVANARVSSQKSEEFFRQNCDFIIENTKDKEYVMTQIKEIFNAEVFKQKSDY
ncbi:MAG: dephospho-CoA kinase [Ruminococcaceae bacterium]|nr:dephospho-CoA kinase [Oscillospiraceae bacterium]